MRKRRVVSTSADTEFTPGTTGGFIAAPVRCDRSGLSGDARERERWSSALRRVESQTRMAGRMVTVGAEHGDVLIRIIGMIKTLRSVGSEVAGRHVVHCVDHGLEHGPEAATTAAGELTEAIRRLVQS